MNTGIYFKNHIDENYKEFHQKLCPTKYPIIGVKIPILRNIAKELSTKHSLEYLVNNIDNSCFENVLLKGLCIAYSKECNLDYIDNYINLIDNWSLCDTFCNTLKFIKKDKTNYIDFINNCLHNNEEFRIRVGLVLLLNYYICDDYKEYLYNVLDNVNTTYYYTHMAAAWLLSYLFIYYYDDTLNYLKYSKLDTLTIAKGITKAIESYRIIKEQKVELKKLRNLYTSKK